MATLSPTYNLRVNAVTLNRALIVLALIGLFIAGVLSLQHLLHIPPPCGADGGCDAVARHPSSYIWMRPLIPVAYVGFVGYAFLFGLAVARGVTGMVLNKVLVGIGFLASALGTLYSVFLQYISFTEIHNICIWCFSSAVTMSITFAAYAWLFTKATESAGGTVAFENRPDVLITGIGFGVLALGLLGMGLRPPGSGFATEVLDVKEGMKLVPDERNQIGPDNAPITIVEFADLVCPSCRANMPRVKALQKKHPNSIRIIYRHFPLINANGHEMAAAAAITAEYAADQNKFWEFVAAFTADREPAKSIDEVYAFAQQNGLDTTELKKILDHPQGTKAFKRLSRDFDDVQKLGIQMTPTFVVLAGNLPAKKMASDTLFQEMEMGEYKKFLKD